MENFNEKFFSFLKDCQLMINKHYTENFSNLTPAELSYSKGRKYIKIVSNSQNHKSVWAFVDKTNGDILKAASWAAPAKHARGNIFDENPINYVGPYGPASLK